jgi:hypothetical protein
MHTELYCMHVCIQHCTICILSIPFVYLYRICTFVQILFRSVAIQVGRRQAAVMLVALASVMNTGRYRYLYRQCIYTVHVTMYLYRVCNVCV